MGADYRVSFIRLFRYLCRCMSGFVELFVCFILLKNVSVIWKCHHYRWRASNFDLYSALIGIDQWMFLSVPHLLWHGSSVYNGHHREPVTLAPLAERFAVDLSLPVLTTYVCRDRYSNPDLPHAWRTLYYWDTAVEIRMARYGLGMFYLSKTTLLTTGCLTH